MLDEGYPGIAVDFETCKRELVDERVLTAELRGIVKEMHDALLGARKHVYLRWLFTEHVGTPDSEPSSRIVLDAIDGALTTAEGLLS